MDLSGSIVGFARTLRAAGVPATHDRVHAFAEALSALDPTRRADVYWAGRLTLCATVLDVQRYDRVFAAFFDGAEVPRQRRRPVVQLAPLPTAVPPEDGAPDTEEETALAVSNASQVERLRHKDVASLTADERAELERLLNAFALPGERRRTRRFRPAPRGRIDARRTVRQLLAAGGEPVRLAHQRHRTRPRDVVLLVDISGSMAAYADVLLRFSHAAARGHAGTAEVFTLGTRLTRVTVPMTVRDPDLAMKAVSDAVPDYGGGTRLGELVKEFLDRHGQRGVARGAVVVILSDGWERGDPSLLGEQTARLQRLAHRIVWANPRAGHAEFAPVAGGMAAALPHCDDLVAGHSLAALEHLAKVVAGAAAAGRHSAAPDGTLVSTTGSSVHA